MACTLALELVNIISTLNSNDKWWEHTGNLFLMDGTTNPLLFAAIFGAIYVGTEYSGNAVRNKLIVGHTRMQIYLSNLAAVSFGFVTMNVVRWIPNAVLAFFGSNLGMTAEEFAFKMFIVICSYIAAAGIYMLPAMLITKKSTGIAVAVIASYVLIYICFGISATLYEPEYFIDREAEENGIEKLTPNPGHIDGAKRDILTAINDIVPMGQMIQMEDGELHRPKLMPLYSLGVLTVTTAAGVLIFRKKDVK